MTREETKELIPIIQAFADGKTIEFFKQGEWMELNDPDFMWSADKYRIKPEPKYRPFKDEEECWQEMLKHQPFGWVKKIDGGYKQIMAIHIDIFNRHCADFAGQTGTACFEFEYIYKNYTFNDGTPFGIKEE